MDTFGAALRRHRRHHDLSLRALGARTHYSHTHLWEIETGRKPPTRELAAALDAALDLDGQMTALAGQPTTPEPLTPTDVPTIHNHIQHLAATDTQHGADHLWRPTAAWHRQLRTRCAATTSQQVWAAVAEAGQIAAWLAHDAARDDPCHRLLPECGPVLRASARG